MYSLLNFGYDFYFTLNNLKFPASENVKEETGTDSAATKEKSDKTVKQVGFYFNLKCNIKP